MYSFSLFFVVSIVRLYTNRFVSCSYACNKRDLLCITMNMPYTSIYILYIILFFCECSVLNMYVYMHTYTSISIHIYIYIYTYVNRDTGRDIGQARILNGWWKSTFNGLVEGKLRPNWLPVGFPLNQSMDTELENVEGRTSWWSRRRLAFVINNVINPLLSHPQFWFIWYFAILWWCKMTPFYGWWDGLLWALPRQ